MTLAVVGAVTGIASAGLSIYNGLNQASAGQQAIGASDPFGPYRAQYAQKLSTLMANPGQVKNLPGYQAGMDSAMQGTERMMASEGYLGSGNEALALQKTGYGYAMDAYNQQIATLATLAGAGTVPNATGAGLAAMGAGGSAAQGGLGQLGALFKMWQGGSSGGGGITSIFNNPGTPSIGSPDLVPYTPFSF